MKGLVEQTATDAIFLVVKHFSICSVSKVERPGYEAIEVNNPKTGEAVTKYVKKFKGVEGLICKIEWYDTKDKYETRFQGWKIHLDAAGVPAILDLPFESRASNRFMKLAENLDFTAPVEFSAWHDAKSDATAFNVKQFDQSVPQKYTRENPGECPAPTQNRAGKWNFDAQKDYLHQLMTDVVIPAVEAAGNNMPLTPAQATTADLEEKARAAVDQSMQPRVYADDEIPF